jgi:hypothetical protein
MHYYTKQTFDIATKSPTVVIAFYHCGAKLMLTEFNHTVQGIPALAFLSHPQSGRETLCETTDTIADTKYTCVFFHFTTGFQCFPLSWIFWCALATLWRLITTPRPSSGSAGTACPQPLSSCFLVVFVGVGVGCHTSRLPAATPHDSSC